MKPRLPSCTALAVLVMLLSPIGTQGWAQGLREAPLPARDALQWTLVNGSDTWLAVWTSGSDSYYALSRDGGATADSVRLVRPQVALRYFRFDPWRESPAIPAGLAAAAEGTLSIVQFATQVLPEYTAALAAIGVESLHFVPWQGVVARVDAAQRAALDAMPFVRWVGPYHAAYKLDRAQLDDFASSALVRREYNVQVTKTGLEEKDAVASFIRAVGGRVHDYVSPHGYLLRAELDADQLLAVIARDDVLFVDAWSAEEPDMANARALGGADYIESVGGYTGAGVRAQVRDTGLDFGHGDWQFAPIPHNGTAGDVSHGSCVYGIVFGSGAGDPTARGLLPDAQGIFHSSGTTVDRFVDTGELLQAPYRCVFETNSTGSTRTTEYTTISADMDNILFHHDVVVLQSQSNAGATAEPRDSRPQAWAKNIVSVGGIRHYDTLTTADDAWAQAGSIGPAADGRIKPDVSMFYDSIRCAEATGSAGYTTGNYYSSFGGTSGATPISAGYVGLIHQMWADGIFNNALVNWDVFDNKPHATLAKALLVNSASPYAFAGAAHDLTRVHQGWGRPDAQRLYDRRTTTYWINETDILTNLQTAFHVLNVSPGETEFHATMVYRDPAGNPGAAVHRINDLTLKCTSPSGTVYWGNNGLDAANSSTVGGTGNLVDTVENVIVPNPEMGPWIVEVIAADVNTDAYVATPAVDASYSLVVSGVDVTPLGTDIGQANTALGSLSVRNSLDVFGQKPNMGRPGPFFASLDAGDTLELGFRGPANRPFALLFGTLNRNNDVIAGVGSLDIGFGGGIDDYSDVAIVLDGVFGNTFLDTLARVDAAGEQTLSFSVPTLPPGVFGTLQALFWDVPSVTLSLTAATEITVL